MQSVELLLDPATSQGVVEQWEALAAADLPSQSQHKGSTNAPHITIGLASAIDQHAESALSQIPRSLPLAVHLGPIVLFEGKNTAVLARMVHVSAQLLEVHEAVSTALRRCPGQVEHLAIGHWVPHVTLARRIKRQSISEALTVLREVALLAPERSWTGHAVDLRRWDSEAKQAWTVPQIPSGQGQQIT
ncbi:MAG: 2'-5' RNA ligase family protein [Ornithinimicrobium sp.]